MKINIENLGTSLKLLKTPVPQILETNTCQHRDRKLQHGVFWVVLQEIREDRKSLLQELNLSNCSKDLIEEENPLFDSSRTYAGVGENEKRNLLK